MPDHADFALRAVHDWAAALPSLDVQPDQLSAAIRLSRLYSLQDRIDEHALRAFDRHGIRGSDDFRVLALLRRARDSGLTNSQLVDALGGSKGGMSARLDRFTEHDLTRRHPSSVDRRSHTNVLTEQGATVADEAVAAVVTARQQLFEQLSSDQVATLGELLAIMIETIDPHD